MFDPALDVPAWPGPLGLGERDAVAGEAWLGPLGLLERLELELGLAARHVPALERAALLAQQLAGQDGVWRASFEADPLATARRLLADRDLLAYEGWRGEPAGARLDALWEVTTGAAPGLPERLHQVLARVERLGRRALDLASLTLLDAPAQLPTLWQRVLAALAAAGVEVACRPPAEVATTGDLAGARARPFVPRGDGSLVLVRPQGPLAAAEEVAAALAACERLDDIVVIGGDAVLDAACVRHGLPRLGAPLGAPGSSALVRLVLEAAFHPMDPADLHALLAADPGPVPRSLARRLARALGAFPGRGSPAWQAALADGLARVEDERRDVIAERISVLVDPVVARDGALTIDQVITRLRALAAWARGRAGGEPGLVATVALVESVLALVQASGLPALSRTVLRRLCDEARAPALVAAPAEAGLACVARPGAIVGPARVIVWWRFSRDAAPSPPRLRLSARERAALAAHGIAIPDPGAVMAAEARRWSRPVALAREALVLVCPRTDDAAELAHPHPLWDELVARMPARALADRLSSPHVQLPTRARRAIVALRPRLQARDVVQVAPLAPTERESPSSLEQLLGCSLAWALQRVARLYPGLRGGPAAPGPLLYGTLAHHVIERVFASGALPPADAALRAEAVFEAELPVLAETLLLPEHQAERAEVKRAIVESCREVARLLARPAVVLGGIEVPLEGALGGIAVRGRADLVLAAPAVVVDFKWGMSSKRARLVEGTAFQLVAYAALGRTEGDPLPGVAYASLRTQRFVGAPGAPLGIATAGEHPVDAMLDGALAMLATRTAELARGRLVAPSAIDELEDAGLVGGVMRVAPECRYCSFSTICGRRGQP